MPITIPVDGLTGEIASPCVFKANSTAAPALTIRYVNNSLCAISVEVSFELWSVTVVVAVPTIIFFTCVPDKLGFTEKHIVAIPDTCGVAIEVPVLFPYLFLGSVLYISVPGATTSILSP